MKRRFYFNLLAILFISGVINAQQTEINNNPVKSYLKASDLFTKEKFGNAQQLFIETIKTIPDPNSEMRINSEYYNAVCAIELFNNDAEYLMLKFMEEHPENLKIRFAYYQLGRHLYYKRRYQEAFDTFDKVDVYDLTEKEQDEYYFKFGYAAFMLEKTDKAKVLFYEIIGKQGKYSVPANYYYGHIAYNEKNYETALSSFEKIANNEQFAPIVPYYITHIYFFQKKYDKVIEYAPAYLEKSTTQRIPEISRIIGVSYFYQDKYKEAIPYLEKYFQNFASKINREDYYQLAFAYYITGSYDKAIQYFEKTTETEDSITQNAYYHLADCYLKTNNKPFALNAFHTAYKYDFNPEIKENAMFNYAKLTYELSFDPYNEAISAFQQYVQSYPDSKKADEARQYLIELYLNTNNFKAALVSFETIKNKDIKLKKAYQKITFYRGLEYFISNQFDSAIFMFDKSLLQPEDESISAQTLYWKAEALYRTNDYPQALTYYNNFLLSPGAFSLPIYYKAHYNVGYTYFKQKKYDEAIVAYRKFLNNKDNEPKKMVADAYLRIGDSYFVSKKYEDAIDYYSQAYKVKDIDADYALFQKALAHGVLSSFNDKILTLKQLVAEYPQSLYMDDAKYEMASTQMVLNKNDEALENFKQIVVNYPHSSYTKKSLLKIGLIHYNNSNHDQALVSLKRVVAEYPATSESKEALLTIKNIYVDMNKADDFFNYAKSIPFASISNSEQDSITYTAIENRFVEGDCQSSLIGFDNYLEKFPNGAFVVKAHYYKAECLKKSGKTELALKDYEYVAAQTKSEFTENALINAASINYELKNYANALNYYQKLEQNADFPKNINEAKLGQMRCHYLVADYQKALNISSQIIEIPKISETAQNEAYLIKGNSAYKLGNTALAQTALERVAKNSQGEHGAQANYMLAEIYYELGDDENTQKYIYQVIDHYSAYNYWFAKSFILLADYYVKVGNDFQAKHTLQSIIDNYKGDDLVEIAHQKLNKLNKTEDNPKHEEKPKDLEIRYNNEKQENNKDLFNEF